MARHHSYSIEFKRQVAREYVGGESLNGLARRHDVSRNLIRVWIAKYEAGAFDDEFQAADLLQQYEAKVAALGGAGKLPPSECAFRVGVDEVLEGGLIDEHGGNGALAAGGVIGAQGAVELDTGRADWPAGAGAAEQSADGLRVRTGGVGVGVGTNRGEVLGRGVLIGEGVDRGERGLCGGSAAPALGLCFESGPRLRLQAIGGFSGEEGGGCPCAVHPSFEAPAGRAVKRGGWVGRKSLPPAGAAQVRGPSFDGATGHRVDHQIAGAILASRLARCRGQRPSPWALILQATGELRRGQIERWRTLAVRR